MQDDRPPLPSTIAVLILAVLIVGSAAALRWLL
jgi:hypothetical protein